MQPFRFVSCVVTLVCAGVFSPLAAQAPVRLTLAEALAAADETSLPVLLGREGVAQAIAAARQSRAALLPIVDAEAGQRRSRSATVGAAGVSQGRVGNRFDAILAARVDVLDPVNIASYRAARLGVRAAELDLEATREDVQATVAQLFFQHLRNIERLAVLDANIERARGLLDLAQRQADAGVATQIDVTRAQAQLATAEQDRLQQETVVQSSAYQLKRLLGIELDRSLELVAFALDPGVSAALRQADAVALATAAFGRRADFRLEETLLDRTEEEVRAARYNRLPAVALTGSYGYASETAFDGDEVAAWSAGVALTLPVFDGGRTRALSQFAQSRRRAQEARVRDLELAIGAEVRLAAQNARSRFAQVDVARTSLELAEEELRLARIRFGQGVADNREIIEAQNRLAVAGDNLVEAFYQYQLSRVALALAGGDVRGILSEGRL